MGIFKKLAKVVDAVVEVTDDSSQGFGPLADAPPVALRPDATTGADLVALHAASGGRAGRATVQWTGGAQELEWGHTRGGTESVQMIVRERTPDGGFGPRIETRVWLPHEAALVIGAGLEVPIIRDPATGQLVEVDRSALIEELRPHFAEALAEEKARRSLTIGEAVGHIRAGYDDLRRADAEAAAAAAADRVEGVTADQWLQARRVVATGKVPEAVLERTLGAYGIPPGRWPQVDAAWSARAATDPALAARLANL